MTTFAQAQAQIEELLDKLSDTIEPFDVHSINVNIRALLGEHAESIAQLWKVAAEMREILRFEGYPPSSEVCRKYDTLLNGE